MRHQGNLARRVTVVAVAAALGLTACSGSSGTGGSGGSGGSTTLTVWDYASGYGGSKTSEAAFFGLVKDIDAKFEQANPGVKIDHKHFGYDGYETKLQAAAASGSVPDVAWEYVDALWKITEPLDDRMSADEKSNLTLYKTSVQAAKDGKTHTMPWGTYQGVWMYNKKIFEQAGVQPPATQADFLAACDKLNGAGVVPVRDTMGGAYKMNRYVALMAGQVVPDIVSWNAQKVPFTSPEYRAGVDAFMAMTQHKCWGPNPQAKPVPGESDQAFRSGKSAILFATQQINVADYEKDIGKGNLGVFLQPALSPASKPNMDASMNNGMMIMKGAKNKDLAWKLISFYEAPEQQKLAWERIQQIPNRTDVKLTSDQPVYQQLLQWASDPSFHVGAWPITPQEFQVYDQTSPEVVAGRISVDTLLQRLQAAREKSAG